MCLFINCLLYATEYTIPIYSTAMFPTLTDHFASKEGDADADGTAVRSSKLHNYHNLNAYFIHHIIKIMTTKSLQRLWIDVILCFAPQHLLDFRRNFVSRTLFEAAQHRNDPSGKIRVKFRVVKINLKSYCMRVPDFS